MRSKPRSTSAGAGSRWPVWISTPAIASSSAPTTSKTTRRMTDPRIGRFVYHSTRDDPLLAVRRAMSSIADLNLIRVFDFYLAVMLLLGIVRRYEQYRAIGAIVLAVPGRWPKL